MRSKNPTCRTSPILKNRRASLIANLLRGRAGLLFSHLLYLLLVCVILFAGCRTPLKQKVDFSSSEQKKAALIAQLNRKFEDPEAHFKLGQLYQADGQWEKAEYHYNTALSFDPAYRDAQAAMVKGLLDNGNKAKAQQYVKTYMNQVSNSVAATLQLAQAFDRQGADDYALACLQQALQLAPNSAEVNKQFGYHYLRNKDTVKAKEYFSRSFQLNPNQPDVASELGRLGVVVKIPRLAETTTSVSKPAKKPATTEKEVKIAK
jgi:tetratricopeptide (TPR) repeat protein